MPPQTTPSILRFPAIKAETGLSKSTLHRRIHDGLFPRLISLGGRAVGLPASEVKELNQARIAGKSDGEIRVLVGKLHDARKNAVVTQS
jgi:prophage regulatory protein